VGEHYLDTVGVGGSIPPVPTKTGNRIDHGRGIPGCLFSFLE